MTPAVREIMKAAEGRYLTIEEAKKALEAARDVERRLAIMRSVEQRESEVVRATIDKVFQKFPKFHQDRPMAYEKAERDISLTLRYTTLAMLNNDPELVREKLLYWLKTILSAMEFGEVTRYTYETLQAELTRALPPNDAQEMAPFLKVVVETLA